MRCGRGGGQRTGGGDGRVGPRQVPLLRQAAAAAGLGAVEVMPAPVAVGRHLLAGGLRLESAAWS
ncbi:hypothetical protein GCM10022255_094570 [Dactylosporangium darangshiense]|uniref:Uncharacterized protein n=1 Tax=Dactylosporangium darangshiense TaxID=579108 RepID=A0ABP8DQ17_9ACTN